MFKRIFSCVACVLLLATVCCQAVAARADITMFTLSVNDGKVGDTVTVAVSLSAESYFTNCTFYMHYDPSVVSYIEDTETTGPISPSTSMLYVMDHEDQKFVKGAYVTVKGIQQEGVLLSLDFTVLKEAAMQFSITFDECVGVDENDAEFDVVYQAVPCTLNAHAAPVVTTTKASAVNTTNAGPVVTTNAAPAATTTAGNNTPAKTTTAAQVTPTAAPIVTTAAPIVTTAGNNTPVTTVVSNVDANTGATTAAGQTVASDVQATTVTNAMGQIVTNPTTVATDAQGNTVAPAPTTVVTDENGVTVTQPVGDIPAEKLDPNAQDPSTGEVIETIGAIEEGAGTGALGIVLIVVACVLVAGGVAVAAVLARKKRTATEVAPEQETPSQEAPSEEATTQETPVEVTSTDEQ